MYNNELCIDVMNYTFFVIVVECLDFDSFLISICYCMFQHHENTRNTEQQINIMRKTLDETQSSKPMQKNSTKNQGQHMKTAS